MIKNISKILIAIFLCVLFGYGCARSQKNIDNDVSTSTSIEETSEEKETQESQEPQEEDVNETYSWELIWSDEFDGNSLDMNKWSYELGSAYNGWGNNEAQYYKEENVYVDDGKLVIEAKRESEGDCDYTSGRIRTITEDGEVLFSTKYGKIEARISMPMEDGMWPAFWMMPVDNKYGMWPLSGEIDIVEARGRVEDEIDGTIHYGESMPNNKQNGGEYIFEDSDIEEFHVYAIEWMPDEIRWYVDDKLYYVTSNWYTVDENHQMIDYPAPFDQSFYLILNLAVGGTYDDGVLPSEDMESEKMYVDYVRVYANEDGYREVDESKKNGGKDTFSYKLYGEGVDFVSDKTFETINTKPLYEDIDYKLSKWYFVTKKYFEGSAKGSVTDVDGKQFFYCDIRKAADKRYSVQLIHRLPLIKGYTYVVEFDGKADDKRAISLQPMGNIEDEAILYAQRIKVELDQEVRQYRYTFTVEEDTDLNGFIEINLGAENPDVYIGNVSIRIID